jgi:glutathione peroxidase
MFYKLLTVGVVIIGGVFFSKIKSAVRTGLDLASSGRTETAPDNAVASSSIYDYSLVTLDGKKVKMSDYKGKKIIILNVASECGFTPQYADWQKFYETNKQNAVVLGFPANNFGSQEPGSNEQIKGFCQKNYGVTFPVFQKVSVKGSDKAPIYQWLTTKTMNGWNTDEPSWNFCKYLVNEEGKLTNFFTSKTKPSSPEFIAAFTK